MKNILLKDGTILFFGTFMNTTIMLLMQMILARSLALDEYGAVMSAFNLINFLALFISLGASEYILKCFGKYGESAYKIVQTWLRLLPISLFILCIVTVLIYTSGFFGELTSTFLLIIIPNIILQGLLPLTLTVYQIEGNYKKIVVINLVVYVTRLVAALFTLLSESSIVLMGYTLTILSIIGLLYFYRHIRRYVVENVQIPAGTYEALNQAGILGNTVKGIMPYALLGFFYYGFFQSNIIFINIFLSESAVGIYNAAFTVISLTFILPTVVISQLFNPKLHFWIKHDFEKVHVLFQKGSKWMLLLGVVIAGVLMLLNEFVINVLFGEQFLASAKLLLILVIIIPIRYIQAVSDAIMNTENQINIKSIIFFCVFIVSLVLNFVMIPKFGLNGVIIATILSEMLLLVLTFVFCRRFIKSKSK